ncbi:MAG: NADP-dependent malic enzyme [Proteobacteria bacterium]|nr:NADP-dependent malic enzyme [Pseudomonadota bacterium]
MSPALRYHALPRAGKIEVVSSKPLTTQQHLSLGYTPGVAEVCLEIKDNPALANQFTSKANLVAVITNGTAVLGLGNIGPLASKPVMEGKAVLFKKFANIDVFDIEIAETDPEKFVDTVARLAPTFGGINLEDIKAPECFYIEEELRKRLDIPVLHDDQHGTAIIVCAAFINALKISGKKAADVRVVCSGAGAAGLACMGLLVEYGVNPKNITLVDIDGVIYQGRKTFTPQQLPYMHKTSARTLADALEGADFFFGLSAGGILKPAMLKTMAKNPVVFAMANPTPEIMPDIAKQARPDAIIGTGRSDFPNQINNVLGFPYLFRGALDCGATTFNTEMKLAAAHALAELAQKAAEPSLVNAYKGSKLKFGPDYIIPKPFDVRLLSTIAPAVAKAAMDSGVASRPIADLTAYAASLHETVDQSFAIMRQIFTLARANPKRIVYPEGEDPRILQTAQALANEGLAHPVILGRRDVVTPQLHDLGLTMEEGRDFTLVDPQTDPHIEEFAEAYYQLRMRDGVTRSEAAIHLRSRWLIWACLMVQTNQADAVVCGITGRFMHYLPLAAHILNGHNSLQHIYAMQLLMSKERLLFLADTHVQPNPTAEQIAEMTHLACNEISNFGIQPRVALLSHSNFGSARTPQALKMQEARRIIAQRWPHLEVEGEMQADTALNMDVMQRIFPTSALTDTANTLIFPDVDSGNIAFNIMRQTIPGADYIGPILLGMQKPIHILSVDAPVHRIINLSALAVIHAQGRLSTSARSTRRAGAR